MDGKATYEELEQRVNELEKEVLEFRHMKVEEAQRKSEEKYRNLVDLIPDPIAIVQDDMNKLINAAFTETFGYTLHDLENGLNLFALVREKDRDVVRKRLNERMAGGNLKPKYECIDIVTKQGKMVPCEVSGSLIHYDGHPADLVIFRDISERKQAEEAIRASNSKFSAAFQSTPNAIVFSSLKDGRIKDVNESFVQISGYSREEVIEKTTTDMGLWKGLGEREKITQELQKHGKLRNFEVFFGRKSGEIGNGLLSATIVDIEGEPFILGTLIDITERKQVEEALQQSEEKLRSLVKLSSDWLWETDKSGIFTYVDPKVKDFLGYDPEEILGKKITDFIIEIDVIKTDLFLKEHQQLFREFESIHVHKDGKHLWVETSGEPFFDTDGNLAGWRGLSRNITDRKQAEEALRESEEKYRSFVEVTSDWIWEMDDKGIFTYVDPKIKNFIGYEAEEVIGKPMSHFMSDEAGKQAQHFLYKYNKLRTPFPMVEITHLHKNGKEVVYETSGVPTFDREGKLAGWKGLNRNITERVRMEKDLQHLRNLLKNIFDSMPSVLIGIDAKGKVTQWNLEAKKHTGIDAQKAHGKPLEDVFPQLSSEMENVRRAIAKREPIKNSKVPQKSEEEIRYSDITVYPLIANGIEGAVIRVDDVTERVRIEEMMIQSEKMLSVGGLAAGMAHEINNPLAGILQNVQVLKNRMCAGLPTNKQVALECGITIEAIENYMEKREMFSMLDSVMASGRRAAKIVDNMLSFSRKSESESAPHDLGELLDKTIELAENDYDLKKKFDFRQIEIIREYDNDVPEITCEGSKIQQVFLNILKNGAQAMAENKDKGKRFRFTLYVKREQGMVRIEIEDNGPGMDEETRKRIFEPFFTTKGVGIGTGLGLSVSYFIITENHGGTMVVESKPGKGAKFIIRLPIIKNAQ